MKTIGPWIIVLLIMGWLFSSLNHVQPPIPQTPTPILGYVAGEEIEAYTSFVKYYDKDHLWASIIGL